MYPVQGILKISAIIGVFTKFPNKRTIYSVLETSPACLLREIILVDDYSNHTELGNQLDIDIDQNFGGYVRLIRQPSRLGLIQVNIM